jgi:multiple sugar transport system ATP-binding protein
MTALSLQHVTRTFPGGIRAVDDLTLDVAEGELLVLAGPSGCGKTTVLRIIAGLETAARGAVMIGGRSAAGVAPRDRDVAMVFQQGALYPHLSVYDNLAFGLKMRGQQRGEIDRRVREAAAVLDIQDMWGRLPGELSGGEQQRVALGRAMVRRPRVLLMDEPLSNLDAALRTQLRHEIRRLHARLGTTTIYVTHDQTEAMTLGQRIAVLREGRLQQVADPQTIYHQPANRFVAGLIGSPAMNFFDGRLAPPRVPGDRRLVWTADGGAWTVAIPGQWQAALTRFEGRPVVLGIRPEHLSLPTADGQTDGPHIPALIEAIEQPGTEVHLYLRAGETPVVCCAARSDSLQVGQRVAVTIRSEHLHFFDGDTGLTCQPCSPCFTPLPQVNSSL